ncbi:MAG: DUF3460 family protein [Usitatibacter sp.]
MRISGDYNVAKRAAPAKVPMYVSDATRFIQEFLEKNPQVTEQQRKNRATWWDKPQDLETWEERAESTVPAASYAYFPLPERDAGKPEESGNKLKTPSRPA